MSCCCQATESQFDEEMARGDLQRYRRKGPDKTTRAMIEAVRSHAASGASLLDIGGGIGALSHELLPGAVEKAVHVDISPSYLAAAQQEAERRGTHDRIRFVRGDFVEAADDLERADVVTLDRVVCCYPDARRLVTASMEKSHAVYALSFPRDTWWVKPVVTVGNWIRRLRGNAFRTYVHPTRAIEALLAGSFERVVHRRFFVFQVMVYRRSGPTG